MQRVNKRRGMLHLAIQANNCGFPIAFDLVAATGRIQDHLGQQSAKTRRAGANFRRQIFYKTASGPGVFDHSHSGDHLERCFSGLPTFDERVFNIGVDRQRMLQTRQICQAQ